MLICRWTLVPGNVIIVDTCRPETCAQHDIRRMGRGRVFLAEWLPVGEEHVDMQRARMQSALPDAAATTVVLEVS